MTEVWLAAPGYEGLYEVSSEGQVRAVKPHRGGDSILRGDVDADGYRRVLLSKGGNKTRHKVHRLVCHAFNGPPPEGAECGHRNGTPADNSAVNLAWLSRSENQQDSVAHGTHVFLRPIRRRAGEGHHQARFSDVQISSLREDRKAGMSERALGLKYGMSHAHVHQILSGKKRRIRSISS